MHLLKVVAKNFKSCVDNFSMTFVPIANNSREDKEYELIEIAEELYVFSTVGIVGKNASGKTSAVDLLALIYDIFSYFRVNLMKDSFILWNKKINLDITFFHEDFLYRYITDVSVDETVGKNIIFENQKLFKRKYFKSYVKEKNLFDYDKYEKIDSNLNIPPDTSILYSVFEKMGLYGLYYRVNSEQYINYAQTFTLYNMLSDDKKISEVVLKLFDDHIDSISRLKDNKYEIKFSNRKKEYVSDIELYEILSSGTSKGIDLFANAIFCLKYGSALIVDEIENHFHKTLVENLINLFKDKSVNKFGATLFFTTHYCELLDLFNRTDNIFVTKNNDKVFIENVYLDYPTRNDLSKSKKFYNNAFGTNVNYESLMNFKRELMK